MRIALSGPSGCGMTTAIKLVAQKLQLESFNYTLRNMAQEKGITLEEISKLALTDPQYDHAIDRKEIEHAKKDNVIVGSRLTVWLDSPKIYKTLGLSKRDAPKFDVKVWLTAPLKVRAARIAERDGKPFQETLARTKVRDAENAARFKKLYKINFSKHEDQVDMLIDNARLTAEETASLIVAAAQLLTKK